MNKKIKILSLKDILPNLIEKGLVETDITIKERRERLKHRKMNKPKIHMIRWHNKKRVYVCNLASITKGKYTDDPKKVTCKNCKKRMWLPR